MKSKTFRASLLITILLASCISPAATVTTSPSIIPPTPMNVVIPTNTVDVPRTQAAETQIAKMLEPYQYSQSDDLTPLNRLLGESVIETLWFTQPAKWWSTQDRQTAQSVLERGMNPGLGVRDLHAQGITGKGITVAIIDQNMDVNHPEFKGKISKYHNVGTDEDSYRIYLHGPAVTSLLVGENIGTAPDAKVYYVAAPSWLLDAQYYADALDWIVAENEKLPEDSKIRVVSVSAIPSGIDTEYKNADAWEAAYQRATQAGILVLDCTYEHGYTGPCMYDLNDPDNITKCIPNWKGPTDAPHERIRVPMSHRSSAAELIEEDGEIVFSYQYNGIGGISWTVPYLSGVLAMGWQINPDLTASQLLAILMDSAYVTDDHIKIINPRTFIDRIKLTVNK